MSCSPFERKIAGYVDGSLEASEVRLVTEHLRECPECAAFAEALERDREVVRMEPPEMAAVDFTAIRAGVRRGIEEQRRPIWWLPALLAAAAILVLVLWRPWVRPGVEVARVEAPAAAVPVRPLTNVRGSAGRALPVHYRAATVRERSLPPAIPQADPALEAALQDFLAAEKTQAAPVAPSPVEIRIVSNDPNVVLILLQQTSGASYE